MSLQNKLQKFTAKKKTMSLTADDGEVVNIELQGLTFEELATLAEYSDKNDTKGAMRYLLFTGLRKALPSDGEDAISDAAVKSLIEEFDGKTASTIIRHIQEISGLGDEKN